MKQVPVLPGSIGRLRASTALGAFLSGAVLFFVSGYLVGFLAAIAVPGEFFAFFGKERTGLALFVLDSIVLAIPLCIAATVWCLATTHFINARPSRVAALCLFGFLAAMMGSYVYAALDFISLEADGKVPLTVFLRNMLLPSWWALPVLLAVPLGIAAGVYLRAKGSGRVKAA